MCPFAVKVPNPRYKNMTPIQIAQFSLRVYGTVTPPDRFVVVSCGKCNYCLKKKRDEWKLRLLNEITQYRKSAFITLSVSPEWLSSIQNDPSPYIRRFFDNIRKNRVLHRNKSVKHWFVTEGGPSEYDDHRFHFHGILFGVKRSDLLFQKIRKSWKYGYVWIGYADARTANYITSYVTKVEYGLGKIFASPGVGLCLEKFLRFNPRTHSFNRTAFAPRSHYRLPVSRYFLNRRKILFDKIEEVLSARYAEGFYNETYFHCGVRYESFDEVRPILLSHAVAEFYDNIPLQDALMRSRFMTNFIVNNF